MATTKSASTKAQFNPADLPSTGSRQYRQGGDYKTPMVLVRAFAKGKDPKVKANVQAITHLGWIKPGGVNIKSDSPSFRGADSAGLTPAQWTVGEPAGPQIAANLQALVDAGAPADAVRALWSVYKGEDVL